MIELVIVTVVIGAIAAVAAPRMLHAVERSRAERLHADQRVFQSAIDHYAAEHEGRTPAHEPDGTFSADPDLFQKRLLLRTDVFGTILPDGEFGPYLRTIPDNPFAASPSFSLDNAAVTAAWRFDSATRTVKPSDEACTKVVRYVKSAADEAAFAEATELTK